MDKVRACFSETLAATRHLFQSPWIRFARFTSEGKPSDVKTNYYVSIPVDKVRAGDRMVIFKGSLLLVSIPVDKVRAVICLLLKR